MGYVDLFQAKDILRREYEGIARKEKSEKCVKGDKKVTRKKFSGECLYEKYGHKIKTAGKIQIGKKRLIASVCCGLTWL